MLLVIYLHLFMKFAQNTKIPTQDSPQFQVDLLFRFS